jgi:hypothetical protein
MRDNAEACPDCQEYVGGTVNDVVPAVLIGAYRFPQTESITGVEAAARTAWLSATSTLDALRLGRWRD